MEVKRGETRRNREGCSRGDRRRGKRREKGEQRRVILWNR